MTGRVRSLGREAFMPTSGQRYASYPDYWRRGPYRRVAQEHRAAVGGVTLVNVTDRPRGSFAEPAMPEHSLQMLVGGTVNATLDLGAGRFRSPFRRGTWTVAPPDVVCAYDLDRTFDILIVTLPDRLLSAAGEGRFDLARLHARAEQDPLVEQLALRLWTLAADAGAPTIVTETLATALAATVLQHAGQPARDARGGLSPVALSRVTASMRERLSEDVSVAELAALVGMSVHHFSRAFKAATGEPPHRFLVGLRIERAKSLLARSRLSIVEIAAEVGYSNPSKLAANFRAIVGSNPSAYRADCR